MLTQVALDPPSPSELPERVREAIDIGRGFVDETFNRLGQRAFGFVPCDFEQLYWVLESLRDAYIDTSRFCEWGSGFGVGCAVAALSGSDACGIEIRPEYVQSARQLVESLDLEVEFYEGSFVPEDYEPPTDLICEDLVTVLSGSGANDEVDVEIDDFDLVFAFPWPGEEALYFDIFDRYAAAGAHLLTYHGPSEGYQLQRKI